MWLNQSCLKLSISAFKFSDHMAISTYKWISCSLLLFWNWKVRCLSVSMLCIKIYKYNKWTGIERTWQSWKPETAGDSWCPWHLLFLAMPPAPQSIFYTPLLESVSVSKLHVEVAQKAVILFMSSSLHFQMSLKERTEQLLFGESNYSISYGW